MKMKDILNTIEILSRSQGFYGRLLMSIMRLKEESEEDYQLLVEQLEGQNFRDTLDLVLFFEC